MNTYRFVLKFLIKSPATGIDAIMERLGEEGCTDALVGVGQPGVISLDFTREAPSAIDAFRSAVADVKRAIPGAQLVEATPEFAETASTKLLFLDIDGVMHSVDRVQAKPTSTGIQYTGDRLFEHLPLLGRILDQCPDVSVVISSSWRDIYTLPDLQGFFGEWRHRVIGTTVSINQGDSISTNRFRECQVLAEQLGVTDWVMVDDQPEIVWGPQIPPPELARKVFWCDPILGLATPLVAAAIVKRFFDDGLC